MIRITEIEHERLYLFTGRARLRNSFDNRIEDLADALSRLSGSLQHVLLRTTKQKREFAYNVRNARVRSVDLRNNRQDDKIQLLRHRENRECLGLHALCRIHEEHDPFDSRERPRNLVRKIDMSRRVYQIQNILLSRTCPPRTRPTPLP